MKLGHWPKFDPEVAHILSFYPRGSSLFSIYGQRFQRYGPIFKIAIFGHETWQVAKVPEVAHIPGTLFLRQGVEIKLIFALRAAVSEIRTIFQNCHIWAWNLAIGQIPEVAHIPSFYPRGRNWAYFCSTGSGFRDMTRLFLPQGVEI